MPNKPFKSDIPFILHLAIHVQDALYPATIMMGSFKAESVDIYSKLTLWVDFKDLGASKAYLDTIRADYQCIEAEGILIINGVAHFTIISSRA